VRGTTSPVEARRPRDAWRGLIDPAHPANDAPARAAAIITSRSPLDAIDAPPAAVPVGPRAELGAASPIAALLSGQARPLAGADPCVLAASDPHGARWTAEIH
jgi:hypothetical protein